MRVAVASQDSEVLALLRDVLFSFDDELVDIDLAAAGVLLRRPRECDVLVLDAAPDDVAELLADRRGDASPPVVAIGPGLGTADLRALYDAGVQRYIVKPLHARETNAILYAAARGHRQIASIGGGAGLYTMLRALKRIPRAHLTAIVTVSDDGGSSGRIRRAFGCLPPGDIRRSLVALSSAPGAMSEMIQYRFAGDGELGGHNLGNLLITALTDITGGFVNAVRAAGDLMGVHGEIVPVSDEPSTLVAELEDGLVVRGERNIDVPDDRDDTLHPVRLWHEPQVAASPRALAALLAADVVTIGPGDLFTSIVAALEVDGIAGALAATRADVVYVCNLMTKPGETWGFTAADHVAEVARRIGPERIDHVLVSATEVPEDARARYRDKRQEAIVADESALRAAAPRARIWSHPIGSISELVRHDIDELGRACELVLAAVEGR